MHHGWKVCKFSVGSKLLASWHAENCSLNQGKSLWDFAPNVSEPIFALPFVLIDEGQIATKGTLHPQVLLEGVLGGMQMLSPQSILT